jgi:hypothetical protein
MITLNDEQKVTLHAQPLTEAGNPAGIDGEIVWETTDPALLTLVPNGFDCDVVTNGPLGIATVSASADSDLGEGVITITGEVDIEVIQAPAATIEIVNEPPELKL